MVTDPAQPDAPPERTPRKPLTPRRLRRKIWRGFLFALAAVLIALLVLTRTGVTRALVLPRLERALGAEIDARSVVVTPDLGLLVRDPVVRVRGIDGLAGEVFTAQRLMVDLDWLALPAPDAIRKIELEAPHLRLSQDAETGAISAARLGLFSQPRTGGPLTLPTVVVRSGVVELGEHRDGTDDYALLAEYPLSGVLAPQPGAGDRSLFSLTRRAGETGLEVTGFIDADGLTFTVGGVDLSDWPASAIPTRFRSLWERLDLDGRIVPRTVAISTRGEVAITVDLERVAITLPFVAEDARSDEPARLTEVTGRLFVSEDRVSADLTGAAGTLEQAVRFDLFGFDPRTSPFVARLVTPRLRWERDIALLDYVPPGVIEQTERFGRPEADVEAVIWLARRLPDIPEGKGLLAALAKPDALASDPDNPDAVRLSGALAMRNGAAAFRGFPYEFRNMSVDFRFTTRRLEIENIEGTSASGARLTGSGWIAPLGPTSAVDLDLVVTGLIVDDELLAALNPARRQLVDVLFNEREYAELVGEGFIRTPEQAAPLLDRLASIEAERAAWVGGGAAAREERARLDLEEQELRSELARTPLFELGGESRVDMRFIRQEGEESIWTRDIRLDFPTVGFLTEMFAMPAIGRDVRVTIGEEELRLVVDEGTALSGGAVTIDAVMDTSDAAKAASPDGNTLPRVRVEARHIPIDPLLIRAIAGPDGGAGDEPGATDTQPMGPARLADLLTSLGLGGRVDADADLVPNYNGQKSRLDYTIRTRLEDLTADIRGADTRMTRGSGTARVNRNTVELDLSGDLVASVANAEGEPATAPDASLRATIQLPPGADWGDLRTSDDDEQGDPFGGARADTPVRPRIDAAVVLPSADLAIPAEPIVALFSASAADTLRDLRTRYRPEGRLGVTTTIRGTLGDAFADSSDIKVAIRDIERVDFDYQALRLSATRSEGHAIVLPVDRPRVAFDDFSVDIATVEEGAASPAGRLSILETVEIGEAFATTPLSITLEGGRFESPLTRLSIERLPTLLGLAQTYEPRGVFDLELRRRRDGKYEGSAHPRTLTVATPRGDLAFPEASGTIGFGPETGVFESIRLVSPDANLAIEGDWTITPDGTVIGLLLDSQSEGLPPALVGIAPQTIGEIFDSLELRVTGETVVESLDLEMRALPGGGFADVRAAGLARFADASLAIGLPATELSGSVRFDAARPDPAIPARFTLDIEASRARLMGLRVTGARATVISGREPGSVLVPDFGADAHGGRLTASVRLSAPEGGVPGGDRRYWTDLQLAEIRIAPLLEDVRVDPETTLADEIRADLAAANREQVAEAIWDQSADRSRGLISANFSLSGTVGTPVGRRGRGRVIAGGGPVLQLPLLTPLIEFSNLQLPVGDELGLAYANLLMDERGMVFENFAVVSRNIELLGTGTLGLPGGELDLRVRSRALRRIPVLTEVVESVRDELISTRIGGTLAEPQIGAITLEETRRVLGSLMGTAASPERLREITREEAGTRARIRRAGALLPRSGDGAVSPTPRGGNDAP